MCARIIKDIVNRDIANLTNCESEPIHIPGSIQPHGLLLGINAETQIIDFCSANSQDFLGLEVRDVIGKELAQIIGRGECDNIGRHIKENNPEQFYMLSYGSVVFSASIYYKDHLLLLEIERSPDKPLSVPDLFEQSRNFVSYLEKSTGLRGLCTHVADEIRHITGYDRVMVYRFDKEFNGEVYAESLNENIESFFGLHYPHTDIPAQARALFARNLLRMIPDANYKPVAIMALEASATNHSLDLSASGLRSVSPVHIEYLKNMGVGASLTVSLIHNKKLWGLIACHHHTVPKILPAQIRISIKLHAHFLTSQISNREAGKEQELSRRINERLDPLIEAVSKNSIEDNKNNNEFYTFIHADGMAIVTTDRIYMSGKTPDKEQITDLVSWLNANTDSDFYTSSRLADAYPGAAAIKDTASGIFFHSLNKFSQQGVIWFRAENVKTISWAGDPAKAIHTDKVSLPRESFALWEEVVFNTSAPWDKLEIDAGIRLATKIQNNIFLTYITRQEKKYRLQSHKLEKLNKELNNFNYICSHDLQEPIRKIRVFSSMLLSDKVPVNGLDKEQIIKKINTAAQRAIDQINDLLEFASIANYSDVMEQVSLDDCLERIKIDLELVIAEKNAVFIYDQLGNIKAIPIQIEQLLYNLIGNSLKFSKDHNPQIAISVSDVTSGEMKADIPLDPQYEYICLIVRDNGIGFDQKFAEKIFDVFYRLDNPQAFSGSGIGLAICKKIVENHQGYIEAKSQKGEGASFYIYLKK